MTEYHKIDSIYKRDPSGKRMLFGDFSRPEFEYLQACEWQWTEKVDGTNVRVMWDGERVSFGGKTDNAQMPLQLIECLQDLFPAEKMAAALKGPMVLYGEGYGPKVQSGGWYRSDAGFILFDAFAGDVWLTRLTLEDLSAELSIDLVPLVGVGTLTAACEYVMRRSVSVVAKVERRPMEGLVMRPLYELRDRRGSRIITKIKVKDFAERQAEGAR